MLKASCLYTVTVLLSFMRETFSLVLFIPTVLWFTTCRSQTVGWCLYLYLVSLNEFQMAHCPVICQHICYHWQPQPPLNKYKSVENNPRARCSVTFWNITLAISFHWRSFPSLHMKHESNGCISLRWNYLAVPFSDVSNRKRDKISMSVSLDHKSCLGVQWQVPKSNESS